MTSSGGTFELKSAYRPTAYQAHLHDVWVKWMKELRNNRTAGCQALREEVGAEFRRHQLLARQQPVPASDHALGLAFDAAVAMPRAARLNRKRVTVDKLANLAGIRQDRTAAVIRCTSLCFRNVSLSATSRRLGSRGGSRRTVPPRNASVRHFEDDQVFSAARGFRERPGPRLADLSSARPKRGHPTNVVAVQIDLVGAHDAHHSFPFLWHWRIGWSLRRMPGSPPAPRSPGVPGPPLPQLRSRFVRKRIRPSI